MVDTPLSSLVKVAPLLDEDDMVSDSAAHGATQQSTKAYAVTGPVASTDEANPRFNGVGGRILQDSLSTENDAGIVTHSGQSAARARLSGNQTVTSGSFQKLQIVTEDYDVQNEVVPYNGGDPGNTGRFVATKAGKYSYAGNCAIDALADQKVLGVSIYINGVLSDYTQASVSGISNIIYPVPGQRDLEANDYVEVFIFHNHGADRTASAAIYQNCLAIHKLS